jgi:hypothetical protein
MTMNIPHVQVNVNRRTAYTERLTWKGQIPRLHLAKRFSPRFTWILIVRQHDEPGVAQAVLWGPFDELDPCDRAA